MVIHSPTKGIDEGPQEAVVVRDPRWVPFSHRTEIRWYPDRVVYRMEKTVMQHTWGHFPMRVRIQGEPMANSYKPETGTKDPPDIVDSRQAGRQT